MTEMEEETNSLIFFFKLKYLLICEACRFFKLQAIKKYQ